MKMIKQISKKPAGAKLACTRIHADEHVIQKGKEIIQRHSGDITHRARIYEVMGNAVRLQILTLLTELDELCVCDISDILGMKIQAVSQHLQKMKHAGLVYTRRDGAVIYYMLVKQQREFVSSLCNHSLMEQTA